MFKVSNGQNPYNVIGKYIRDHITAIEDMIAVIEVNGVITNELFMVNMNEDGYFVWKSDWWEGEENVALIDFFPVSDAQKPSEWSARKTGKWIPIEDSDCWRGYICNKCGKTVNQKENYCPNCGAIMENNDD